MPANSLSLIRIVDDDAEMRESLEFLLSTEGWKSRSYASAEAFLETDDVMVPGCLILDILMPGLSGLQLQELLKKKDYSLPILFITAHGDITMAVEAVKNGAFDFLPKPLDDEKLLASVEKAIALDWERRSHHTSHTAAMKDLATLTPREREVAGLVAEGLLNKVIAERLGIAEKTVQIHRGQVQGPLRSRDLPHSGSGRRPLRPARILPAVRRCGPPQQSPPRGRRRPTRAKGFRARSACRARRP